MCSRRTSSPSSTSVAPRGHRMVARIAYTLAVCSRRATCSLLTSPTEACDKSRASPGARKGPFGSLAPDNVTSSFRIPRQHVLKAGWILGCWTRRRDRSRGSRPTLPEVNAPSLSTDGSRMVVTATAHNARCGECPSDLMRRKMGARQFAWSMPRLIRCGRLRRAMARPCSSTTHSWVVEISGPCRSTAAAGRDRSHRWRVTRSCTPRFHLIVRTWLSLRARRAFRRLGTECGRLRSPAVDQRCAGRSMASVVA